MSLSANSIIHLTPKDENLKGIIESGFITSLCKEKITLNKDPLEVYVPMVSFCDIPLSKIKDHISKYGSYGIGLTKDWAQKNSLNPVLYMQQGSYLSKNVLEVLKRALSDESSEWSKEEKQTVDVLRYIKNYQDDLVRKDVTTPEYRFSDEREWRFVPGHEVECDFIFSSLSDKEREVAELKLSTVKLTFEASDIKYLITDKEEEISTLIRFLRETIARKCTLDEFERLTTRILTTEQIMSDV